jgi:hypothetical protein
VGSLGSPQHTPSNHAARKLRNFTLVFVRSSTSLHEGGGAASGEAAPGAPSVPAAPAEEAEEPSVPAAPAVEPSVPAAPAVEPSAPAAPAVEQVSAAPSVPAAPAEEPVRVLVPITTDPHDLCAAALLGLTLGKCSSVAPSSTVAFIFETTPLNGRCIEADGGALVSAWLIGFKYYAQLWAVRADVIRTDDDVDDDAVGCQPADD